MLKSDKERVVAELTERLRETETMLVADYRGLTMTDIDNLRTELLQHGARFRVIKNTLTRRAAEAAGAEALLSLLEGPTAIAFLESDGDPVAVAKALSDVARAGRVLVIRGGILEGATITADEVEELAKLPPADVLRAQLVGALAGALQIVGLFAAPMRDFVGVLDARIKQLEESGDAPGAVVEAAAESGEAEAVAEEAPDESGETQAGAQDAVEPAEQQVGGEEEDAAGTADADEGGASTSAATEEEES
jgi:large subunit ribosomal protein L10